ncbi:MAG: glycerophosphodiester phosphodiesterase family protein [Candidatus Saccharimonadales bacterium]
MLIIGHRGAAGEKPENSLAAIKAGIASGADVLEFDVRLTKDQQLVLMHDKTLVRTHAIHAAVADHTLKQLQKLTAGSSAPICTLAEVFHVALGQIMLNIELKDKGSGLRVLELLGSPEFKGNESMVFLSSFSARELTRVRALNKKIKLAMLMRLNPFAFLAWERKLHLSAVGLHRLHLNPLSIQAAHQLDIFVYVYTVNRPAAKKHLEQQGVDGLVTDYPSKFVA